MTDPRQTRFFDMVLGVLLGSLGAGLSSSWLIGQRVSAVEVELRVVRRDLDALLARPTGTTTFNGLPGGNIQRSIATGENER